MKKTVFIVEDEMILNEQLRRVLNKNGYSVEMFAHGEPCLERLDSGTVPDLILMDINLGIDRLTGPEVTKRIYERYDIPVVLHSAYTDKATLDTTKDMIKYGYVQKVPGNEQFILATLEMAIKLHSTEIELRKRENLYRELFDNTNDAVYLHRLEKNGKTGHFIEVNRIACRRLGYTKEELLEMSPADLDVGERRKDEAEVVRELQNTGVSVFEVNHRAKNGTSIPVEISAHLFKIDGEPFVLSAVRDISKRKAAEEQLKSSEEFHRTTLSSISDTVLLTDEEGRFIYVCPNVDVIFGYSPAEVEAFSHISNIFGDSIVTSGELDGEGEIYNIKRTVEDKDKRRHVLLINVKRVTIIGGSRLYTFRDITELSKKEEELKRSEQMYRELSTHLQNIREEQNAELSREIHDDLGQSLTALKMNITFLDQSLEEHNPDKESLKKTVQDMERIIGATVKKVRKISTELRPSVIDAEGIIEALEWQVDEFKKNFNISVELSTVRQDIELGEKNSLHVFRIVQESLTNCVRHSGATEVHISTDIKNSFLFITVKDNGHGFDIDSIEENGSFGLLGMKERAKQCGGTLDIMSSPGDGTTLQLQVPIQ